MRKLPRTAEHGAHRTDPDYAPNVEIFDSLTHQDIHAGVQLLDPAALSAGKQAWQGSATGLAEAVEQAHNEIRAAIADGWRGSAAQQAADAVHQFEQSGQQLADVMSTVAQRLGQAGDAAEALRAAVVEPSSATPDLAAALLDPAQATSNTATQKATEHSRQDVVQAMDSIYTNAFIPSGSGIPAFPDETTGAAPQEPGSTSTPQQAMPVSAADSTMGMLTAQHISTPAPLAETPESTAAEETAPAAASETTPAAVSPAAGSLGSTAAATGGLDTTPAAPRVVAAAAEQPASGPAAITLDRAPRTASGTPVVAAATVAPSTVPGSGGNATAADEERKREERRKDSNSDAVSGIGAGAMGGMMGGALAAADTPRQSASSPQRAAQSDYEDDDDLHFVDDELTFLEPADEAGELIGAMDPTTPPVLGEWSEYE
ncbi:hypothetical protein [Nocardia sp. NBC_01009]|uniref:PPE domain-containing protein n=1 Tax=Nocardia sp. NBC_01009 TaxID=2975996 RepID=UPI003870601C|nr:hypothetical protein OHA42_36140 [Nocardia sp. NBC_01009]